MDNFLEYETMSKQETLDEALKLARGRYQKDILLGRRAISGRDLKGVAKRRFKTAYRQSVKNLLDRCARKGLNVKECRIAHGEIKISIGESKKQLAKEQLIKQLTENFKSPYNK